MARFTNIRGIAKALNDRYGWKVEADHKLGYVLNTMLNIGKRGYNYNLDQLLLKLSDGDTRNNVKMSLGVLDRDEVRTRRMKDDEPHWEDEMPEANMDYVRAELDKKLETESVVVYITESQLGRLVKRLTKR